MTFRCSAGLHAVLATVRDREGELKRTEASTSGLH